MTGSGEDPSCPPRKTKRRAANHGARGNQCPRCPICKRRRVAREVGVTPVTGSPCRVAQTTPASRRRLS